MSTPLSAPAMGRLALIRYLYIQGVDQSEQPEPMALLSILTFHDAVEMFCHLACEIGLRRAALRSKLWPLS